MHDPSGRADLAGGGAGVGFRVLGQTGGDRMVVEGLVDVGVDGGHRVMARPACPSLLDELAPVTN